MDVPEKNKVPVDLIAKFLNGDADTNDIIDLEQWKNASGENKKVFEEYRRIWEKTGQISIFADIDIESEWNIFLENLEEKYDSKREPRKISLAPFLKIAAALLIGLILGYAGWFSYRALRFEYVTAKNEIIKVDMPDGSLISLNRNSSITYPKKFNRKRELVLNGEAFFEVYADPGNPFIIKSGKVRIEVIGTSFNVIAHKQESIVQVYVESGKVAVYDDKNDPVHKNFLEKGDRMIYSRESGMRSVQPNKDLNYKSWRTGVYQFENSSLQYVMSLLEKNFQTNIELVNPLLNECRINVSFQDKSLEYILETITETLDLELVKTEKGYLIDGPEC
jgi:transmembrane sensor